MIKIFAGLLVVTVVAVAAALFIYPFVFTGVQGLFEHNDLGAILGLLACVLVTIPLIWLTIALVVGSTFGLSVAEDRRRFKRQQELRRNARR